MLPGNGILSYLPAACLFLRYISIKIMDTANISLVIAVLAFLIAIAAFFKKPVQPALPAVSTIINSAQLKLQAYERLVLLCERIALPNLISRLNKPGISAFEMKIILTENIKQEFEYNSTQQLYVEPASWDAVKNLKEQNIMIVNQMAATLSPEAGAGELNKKIIELLLSQPGVSMHELVLKALNAEAKKVLQ